VDSREKKKTHRRGGDASACAGERGDPRGSLTYGRDQDRLGTGDESSSRGSVTRKELSFAVLLYLKLITLHWGKQKTQTIKS